MYHITSMKTTQNTITCPNCGASTTNHQNCEYCGSFLVQKASQGVDMSDYVQSSKTYYNEGFVSVFKGFVDDCMRFPDRADRVFGLGITIDEEGSMPIQICFQEGKGMVITLLESDLCEVNAKQRFQESNVFSLFSVSKEPRSDGTPSIFDKYTAIFGYDYEGAALVCLQLLQEVFKPEPEKVFIEAYLDYYSLYNINGRFVEGDDQADIDDPEEECANRDTTDNPEKEESTNWSLVYFIVFAFAIGIGIFASLY